MRGRRNGDGFGFFFCCSNGGTLSSSHITIGLLLYIRAATDIILNAERETKVENSFFCSFQNGFITTEIISNCFLRFPWRSVATTYVLYIRAIGKCLRIRRGIAYRRADC